MQCRVVASVCCVNVLSRFTLIFVFALLCVCVLMLEFWHNQLTVSRLHRSALSSAGWQWKRKRTLWLADQIMNVHYSPDFVLIINRNPCCVCARARCGVLHQHFSLYKCNPLWTLLAPPLLLQRAGCEFQVGVHNVTLFFFFFFFFPVIYPVCRPPLVTFPSHVQDFHTAYFTGDDGEDEVMSTQPWLVFSSLMSARCVTALTLSSSLSWLYCLSNKNNSPSGPTSATNNEDQQT